MNQPNRLTWATTILLVLLGMLLGGAFARPVDPGPWRMADQDQADEATASPADIEKNEDEDETDDTAPTETIPPNTPLATLTPSQTLKPPPTFEPPTMTLAPSSTPTNTATPTVDTGISVQGLRGLETATPSSTPGCTPRADWTLTYTVQPFDALEKIANKYGITVQALAEGNCITDVDTIRIDQVLHVPGEAHPVEPDIECVPWELMTPIDNMITVPENGQLTFNWIGPRAPLNLIRIYRPDDEVVEELVELRQHAEIQVGDRLPDGGWYTWQVFPLYRDFTQINCLESPIWTFRKDETPSTSDEDGEDTGSSGFGSINIELLLTQAAGSLP